MNSALSQSVPATAIETSSQSKTRRWPLTLAAIWLILVLAGLSILWRYANTPGIAAQSNTSWPGSSLINLNRDGKTLVMFAHPHCPCTRASLGELERLLAQCPDGVTPWVVFYRPSEVSEGWEHSDLWQRATSIPTVHVITDIDGREAKKFGAVTSGQTYVFDGDGDLLFSGGITSSRGHEGDNPGRTAIVELLNHGVMPRNETHVFGCPINHE
jgi:hypothetical protein